MKQMRNIRVFKLGLLSLVLLLGGCITIPTSPTPRYYALYPVKETSTSKMGNLGSGFIVCVGPVKIPAYQDRPQIVTIDKNKMLQFAEFDRWGESLDLGLARLIREDLATSLPGAVFALYPWNPLMAVRYQLAIEVLQLDSELDGDLKFSVQWMIVDLQNSKTVMIKKSTFYQPIAGHDFAGLAKALSIASASLSSQIAGALEALQKKG